MKRSSLVIMFVIAFLAGTLVSNTSVGAAVSVSSLQKEIQSLKNKLTAKDKEIKKLKAEVAKYKKDADTYKANAAKAVKSNVGYQGNILSGNYQSGNKSVPVLLDYRGVRYAPIDMVGSLLGEKTAFDRSKNTYYFGTKPEGSYLSDLMSPYKSYRGVDINEEMTVAGEKYNKGYSMYFGYDGVGYSLNLKGKYTQLTGILGFEDESAYYANMEIYGDGILLATYELNGGELPKEVDLDVTNVHNLKVVAEKASAGPTIDFVNIVVR
ncbi:NPCBM/NEW2 domain-containing protein [Cytobacillus massiliigabonensis]|uniref:NPCBM/NEW2 domain-containing protein n=1 Tax=Cytobacillus massiliigabonensis TaxID=1871011 RepID=UPI0015E0680F|nr:NPCBM/NEW2 domain-containing protein [Cytobacillus massiliigabonensis]